MKNNFTGWFKSISKNRNTPHLKYDRRRWRKHTLPSFLPSFHFLHAANSVMYTYTTGAFPSSFPVHTKGAGSNCETTWWMKTARWAGRDFSRSMLWKQLHSPLIWQRRRRGQGQEWLLGRPEVLGKAFLQTDEINVEWSSLRWRYFAAKSSCPLAKKLFLDTCSCWQSK